MHMCRQRLPCTSTVTQIMELFEVTPASNRSLVLQLRHNLKIGNTVEYNEQ